MVKNQTSFRKRPLGGLILMSKRNWDDIALWLGFLAVVVLAMSIGDLRISIAVMLIDLGTFVTALCFGRALRNLSLALRWAPTVSFLLKIRRFTDFVYISIGAISRRVRPDTYLILAIVCFLAAAILGFILALRIVYG